MACDANTKTYTNNATASSLSEMAMLFIRTCPDIVTQNLTNYKQLVLCEILINYVGKNNICILNSATKEAISRDQGVKLITVGHIIRSFIKSEILIKEKIGSRSHQYFLNPKIFGEGGWMDCEHLSFSISIQYNFKTFEYNKSITVKQK